MEKKVFKLDDYNNFREEGFIKIKINNLDILLDQIEKEMFNISLNISKKLNIKLATKQKLSLHSILLNIYNINPKAFSYIFDCVKRHPEYYKLISSSLITNTAKSLLTENKNDFSINMTGDELIMQRPGDDININGMHQDGAYFSDYGSSEASVVCWIPLFDCKIKNGALQVIPKSHKNGILPHHKNKWEERKKVTRNFKGLLNVKKEFYPENAIDSLESIECKRGEVLFLHYDLIHRSGLNSSNDIRIVYTVRYHNTCGKNYIEKYKLW